jgi:hypothetical protein
VIYAELQICERYGWTWDELMATDAEVVGHIFNLFAAEREAQSMNATKRGN